MRVGHCCCQCRVETWSRRVTENRPGYYYHQLTITTGPKRKAGNIPLPETGSRP